MKKLQWAAGDRESFISRFTPSFIRQLTEVLTLVAEDERLTCTQAVLNGDDKAALRSASKAATLDELPELLVGVLPKIQKGDM